MKKNMPISGVEMNPKFKNQKIIGYTLLIVGLCLMAYSIVSVISVFTGGNVPIEILHAEETSNTHQETTGSSNNNSAPNIDMSQLITPMFPMFNLMAWLTIAFFLLIAGQRLARVGIEMMKLSLPKSEKTKMEKEKENKIIDKKQ